MRTAVTYLLLIIIIGLSGCSPPEKKGKTIKVKHNYIVLLDLSDRLVVQENQPERDKKIIKEIYGLFEAKVKKSLYIKSRDEMKVVIAPQRGTRLKTEEFEDQLYVNMDNIKGIHRKAKEEERRENFVKNIDALYSKAVFSKNPKNYYGADIWKYFYEDLNTDYSKDTLTQNFLFILTDGYPIVGKRQAKLGQLKNKYPELQIVLLEASPREKDMEWDRIMGIWENWFQRIGVKKYTLIKRGAISKELEQIKELLEEGS